MKTQGGTLENLGLHSSRALTRLVDWLDGDGIFDLVAALGLSLPDTPAGNGLKSAATDLAIAATGLHAPAESLLASLEVSPVDRVEVAQATADLFLAIEAVLAAVEPVRQAVAGFEGVSQEVLAAFAAELPKRLIDFVAITHIETEWPFLLRVLVALGIVALEEVDADETRFRPRHIQRSTDLERLKLLLDPSLHPAETLYRWGHDDLRASELLEIVSRCALSVGIPAFFSKPDDGEARIDLGPLQLRHRPDLTPAGFAAQIGVEALSPQSFEFPLGPSLEAELLIDTTLHQPPAVLIEPGSPLRFESPEAIEEGTIAFRIAAASDSTDRKLLLLGQPDGTRLEADSLNWRAELRIEPGERGVLLSPSFLATAEGGAITVGLGETDNFLSTLLVGTPSVDFNFGLGWDPERGLHLGEGVGLAMVLPIRKELGPVSLDALHLELAAVDSGIQLQLGVTIGAVIGPVAFSIDRVGGTIDFATNRDDAKPLGIDFGYLPPKGLAVTIDAGVVSGGGFLQFDRSREEYSGALQLEAAGVQMSAIGILATRLPEGMQGYSFLAVVSAEFLPPIHLGYGFSLKKVGGLLGIHRSLQLEALRAGLATGAIDSVLFPADPVVNAQQILRDLAAVFPPSPGRHVFGPVVEIDWGAPRPMVKSRLAVLVEMPEPVRVTLLGRVRMFLPDEAVPLARINLDAVGTWEPGRSQISLDARLFDSALTIYALTGEMAMRVQYGERPQFALAVGGFHPAFQPPPGFPDLQRVAISMSAGNNPRLRLEAYLALTSNTLQIGARLDVYAAASGFSISGTLAFDGLFQFSPFQLALAVSGRVALKRGSQNLMGLTLNLTLTGIAPWRVRGEVTFEILLFKGSIRFDRTFGGGAQPVVASVQVAPLLKEALESRASWSAELATDELQPVSLSPPVGDPAQVMIQPWATPTVRQKVVPLGIRIDRLGQARPSDGDRFTLLPEVALGKAAARREVKARPVSDFFAAAQFQDLSESDKLSRPSFESMQSGVALGVDWLTAGTSISKSVEYKETLIDSKRRRSFPMDQVGTPLGLTGSEVRRAAQFASRRWDSEFAADSIRVEVSEPEFALTDLDSLLETGLQPEYQPSHSALSVGGGAPRSVVVERPEIVTETANWFNHE